MGCSARRGARPGGCRPRPRATPRPGGTGPAAAADRGGRARGPGGRRRGGVPAGAAAAPGRWRQQAILGRGRWEAEALRDIVRDHALETLAGPEGGVVGDEEGGRNEGRQARGG